MKRGGWVAWGFGVILTGCQKRSEVQPARPAARVDATSAEAPQGDPSGRPYRVVEVAHGAEISGVVQWQGPREVLPPVVVGPSGSPHHCGAEQVWPALEVSAEGGVSNAVVYLDGVSEGVAASPTVVAIDQQHCRYAPHVVAMALGGRLRFSNSDTGVLHNVHGFYGYTDDDSWFNAASPYGVPIERAVTRTGVHRIACDAGHPWMLAYVWAFRHPYFAVTGADGRFVLRDVVPGTYRVMMWHEGWRRTDGRGIEHPAVAPPVSVGQAVTVGPSGRATVRFVLNAG